MISTPKTRLTVLSALFLAVLLILLLSGCAGGTPLVRDKNYYTVTITLRDQKPAKEECGIGIAGCAVHGGDYCIIAVEPPKYLEDNRSFAIIGKEVWHCFKGDYHKPGTDRI